MKKSNKQKAMEIVEKLEIVKRLAEVEPSEELHQILWRLTYRYENELNELCRNFK